MGGFAPWTSYQDSSLDLGGRPILALDYVSGQYGGLGMITRPIWKCPCIALFITYFRHLEKRHPYWPETKSRPILARANMGLDMEMIL
jgi:hypothetical protein